MFARIVASLALLGLLQLVASRSVEVDLKPGVYSAVRGSPNVQFSAYEIIEDDLSPLKPNGNDFIIGLKRPGSVLAKREMIFSWNTTHAFTAYTAGIISYIEAIDQTNGTGGYVRYYRGGIQERQVQIEFNRLPDASAPIDFVVEVWTLNSNVTAVPAENFQLGELGERDQFELAIQFDYPASEDRPASLTWTVSGMEYSSYTFVEAWDMTGNGTGGYISVINGGIGQNYIQFSLQSAGPGVPLRIAFAIYKVVTAFGGSSFRFGRYWPGQLPLGFDFLEAEASPGERVEATFAYSEPDTTIQFIQAWDNVVNGTSVLSAIAGGLGYSNVSMIITSGLGQELDMIIGVYGRLDEPVEWE